jgi:hypothetical protein
MFMKHSKSQGPKIVQCFTLFALGMALLTGGCVVRTQDFHCALEEDVNKNFELRMTPTSLDLDSINYSFVEEQGAKRIYENKALNQRVTFDLASTKLEQSQDPKKKWTCKRYEPY